MNAKVAKYKREFVFASEINKFIIIYVHIINTSVVSIKHFKSTINLL